MNEPFKKSEALCEEWHLNLGDFITEDLKHARAHVCQESKGVL